jgi:hypothetical protein
VIDALEALKDADSTTIYVEDTYGGHYSAGGNAIIAQLIAHHVGPLLDNRESPLESPKSHE